MKQRMVAWTLVLVFVVAGLGAALSVVLWYRAYDGQKKAERLRAEAEELEYGEPDGIWAIDKAKQLVYEQQDALTIEIKDLEQQIKDDEAAIARDKENLDELTDLYRQLDEAALRTEAWQLAAELFGTDASLLEDVRGIVSALDGETLTPEEAVARLNALKPETAEPPAGEPPEAAEIPAEESAENPAEDP